MVEACVVCLWECDDELTWTLVQGQDLDAVRHQSLGRQHRDQLEQKIWLLLKELWDSLFHGLFKLDGVARWNAVPRLCFAPVHVVDRVCVVVFVVPAKCRETHAHIQPRDHHSRDVGFDVAEQGFGQDGHPVQV